jgi:hypothetical protein
MHTSKKLYNACLAGCHGKTRKPKGMIILFSEADDKYFIFPRDIPKLAAMT